MESVKKQEVCNEVEIKFQAISMNESFARVAVSAFVASLNLTVEELADVKTAVSEAVTNAIIHAYRNKGGIITMNCKMEGEMVTITIIDEGIGMANVEQAMEPLYTTSPELERSGMGFSFMEAFMDELEVTSTVGVGTCVRMKKRIGLMPSLWDDEE